MLAHKETPVWVTPFDDKTFTVDSGVCGPLADRSGRRKMESQKGWWRVRSVHRRDHYPARGGHRATHKFLEYVQTHHEQLFAPAADAKTAGQSSPAP